jgi:hypothetical protein
MNSAIKSARKAAGNFGSTACLPVAEISFGGCLSAANLKPSHIENANHKGGAMAFQDRESRRPVGLPPLAILRVALSASVAFLPGHLLHVNHGLARRPAAWKHSFSCRRFMCLSSA